MTNRTNTSRRSILTASVLTAVAFSVLPASGAFAAELTAAPISISAAATAIGSDVLSGTPWETTGAVDQDGNDVALTHEAVANFVGWAYYKTDGTFTMYNLDDTPKMQGDWTVSSDGSERTLVAKDADGEILFERVVPITELTDEVFAYRVVPDAAVADVYYDIVHTPTNHAEPGVAVRADEADSAADETAEAAETTSADAGDSDASAEQAETVGAGPIAAIAAGAVVVLGGAALFFARMMRRGRTS